MESIKLSVQTDHKFLTPESIFCGCITNVKTLIAGCEELNPGVLFPVFEIHKVSNPPWCQKIKVKRWALETLE